MPPRILAFDPTDRQWAMEAAGWLLALVDAAVTSTAPGPVELSEKASAGASLALNAVRDLIDPSSR